MTKGVRVLHTSPYGHGLVVHEAATGRWSLPGGGIEDGETAEIAARRHVRAQIAHSGDGKLEPWHEADGVTILRARSRQFQPMLSEMYDQEFWSPPDFVLKNSARIEQTTRDAFAKLEDENA